MSFLGAGYQITKSPNNSHGGYHRSTSSAVTQTRLFQNPFLIVTIYTPNPTPTYTISLIPFPGPNLPNPTPRLQLFFLSLLPSLLTSRLSPLNLATKSLTGLRLRSILPASALSGLAHRGTPSDSNVGVRLRARLMRLSFVGLRLERGSGGSAGSGGLVSHMVALLWLALLTETPVLPTTAP